MLDLRMMKNGAHVRKIIINCEKTIVVQGDPSCHLESYTILLQSIWGTPRLLARY